MIGHLAEVIAMTPFRDPKTVSKPIPEHRLDGCSTSAVMDPLGRLRDFVDELAAASLASTTRRAYADAWRAFEVWTNANGFTSLPASGENVALYLAQLATDGRKATTIARALVTISQVHRDAGYRSPRDDALVRKVLRGIRRRVGFESVPKTAVSVDDLGAMTATCGDDLRGVRDRAILTLGFAIGLRRSELVALEVEDLMFVDSGVVVCLRRSKTDQEGLGRRVGARLADDPSLCPVRTLQRWLDASKIGSGPVFRAVTRGGRLSPRAMNARGVARIVKAAARRAGLDEHSFGAHSLRSGFATCAALAGRQDREIARVLGHASTQMARRYIRDAPVF